MSIKIPDDSLYDGFRAGEHDDKSCRHFNSIAANMAGGAWCPKCGAFRTNAKSAWQYPFVSVFEKINKHE